MCDTMQHREQNQIVSAEPILLTMQMPEDLWISTYRSTGSGKVNPFQWEKEHRLPNCITRSTDYNPPRMHILTRNPSGTSHEGWSCDGQWSWHDSPIGARQRLFQTLIAKHLRDRDKERLSSAWIIEGPDEITGEEGDVSKVWICAEFHYTDIEGTDGIVVEIRRKVQAAHSIWEESKSGIHVDNTSTVRVKVAVADDSNRMASMHFLSVTDMDLNNPAWEGSDKSVAEYWAEHGHPYTAEQAAIIPIVLVGSVDNPSRYPADKVFRVMTMDQWSGAVRNHLSDKLNLRPSKYLELVKKAMGWLNGWVMKDWYSNQEWELADTIRFGWNDDLEVKLIDSRDLLLLPDGSPMLDKKWRWGHHLRNFESLHERPPPSLEVHFVIPPGHEDLVSILQDHAKRIFNQIPHWADRAIFHDSHIIPDDSMAKADDFVQKLISEIQSEQRSVVVFSALPPKNRRGGVDLYKCLKYNLDEVGIVHQNFTSLSKSMLKKQPDYSSSLVNSLQMLIKHGFLPVPYCCSIGEIDVISALDVGRLAPNESVTAFAVSITKSGKLWGTTPKAEPQRGENISEQAIRRTIRGLISRHEEKEGVRPRRILILRDGNTPRQELRRLNRIVAEYRDIGVDICWVSVRKTGSPRLLNFDEASRVSDEIPMKGHWMQYGSNSAWIWTTGSPELQPGRPGIPQGAGFTIEINFHSASLSVEEVASLLIVHAHAGQTNPWNSTRLPFVHHLADKMAKAMANGEIPLDQNGVRFSAV